MTRSIDPQKIAFWQARVDAQAQSCLNVADFCNQQECSVGAFYISKRQLQELAQDGTAGSFEDTSALKTISNHFVEVIPKRPIANNIRTASISMVGIHLRSESLVRVPTGNAQLLEVVVESLRSEF